MEQLELKTIDLSQYESSNLGTITEYDRLLAGKQILLGLAILYIITLIIYVFDQQKGSELIEVAKMVFPPLATLIIAFYFRDSKGI